jgi:hypothetical protein
MLVVLVDRYAVLPQLLGDFSTLRFSFMIGNVILWDFYGGLQFNHSRNIETTPQDANPSGSRSDFVVRCEPIEIDCDIISQAF